MRSAILCGSRLQGVENVNRFSILYQNGSLVEEFKLPSATPWCNGSTTVFGTVCLGSNPGGVAIVGNVYFISCPQIMTRATNS